MIELTPMPRTTCNAVMSQNGVSAVMKAMAPLPATSRKAETTMTGRGPILSLNMPASGLKTAARMVVGRKTSPASTGVICATFTMKSGRISVMPMNDALSRFCAMKLTT